MGTPIETGQQPGGEQGGESPVVDNTQKLTAELIAMKVDSVTQKLQPGETPQQGILRNNNEAAEWQAKADAATNPVEASNASFEALVRQSQADALTEVHGVPAEAAPVEVPTTATPAVAEAQPAAATELPAGVASIDAYRQQHEQQPATLEQEAARRSAANG